MYSDLQDVIDSLHGVLDRMELRLHKTRASRVFWHGARVKWYTPPVWLVRTYETDEPFRRSRSVMIRVFPRKAIVLGFWSKEEYDEASNLLDATIIGRTRSDAERGAYDEERAFVVPDPVAEEQGSPVQLGRPGLRDGATRSLGTDVDGGFVFRP